MRAIRILLILALAAACTIWVTAPVSAQFGGLKDKAKKKAEEKAKQKAEDEAKKATEGSDESSEQAEEPSQEGETDEAGASADESAPPKASGKPGEGVWVNYDFVPGDRVIFFDDFTNDVVGNFPQRLELLNGNMEVAEWKGRRWLRTTTYSDFILPLPEVLPPRFTIEFDMYQPSNWGTLEVTGTAPEGEDREQWDEAAFSPYGTRAGVRRSGSKADRSVSDFPDAWVKQPMHCRIMADGKYVKVYVNELRVANFPSANFLRANSLLFEAAANPDNPMMLADFRVAASDKKMYDAIVADGRVATHGILFDSGSDKIRPESTPTLKEIGQMLNDHADLRLVIEGHTDSQGDDTSNQDLSERRANSVRSYLIAEYKIADNRLEAKGFGETHPVSSNDSPEGRQNNRRVELVKI